MVMYGTNADPAGAMSDKGITAKAKGILAYLMQADGEHMTLERMESEMMEGEGALRRGIKELEQAGYLERTRQYDANGAYYDWVLKV